MGRLAYRRRRPEQANPYEVVRRNLRTFIATIEQAERLLPRHVIDELEATLRCGILAHGFARVRCGDCGFDRLVAFSCKGRGFCPSCQGVAAGRETSGAGPVQTPGYGFNLHARVRSTIDCRSSARLHGSFEQGSAVLAFGLVV